MRRIFMLLVMTGAFMLVSCSNPEPPGASDIQYIGPGLHMTGYHGNEVAKMDGYLVCAGVQEVVSSGPYKANSGITYNKAYEPQIDRLLENPDLGVVGAFGYVQYKDSQWAYGLMIQLAAITRDLNDGEFTTTPKGQTFKVPKKCWVEAGDDVVMGERPFGVEPTNVGLEGEPALTANN